MQSESARMSSAAEARYRIDAPNSKPRAVKVIALDHAERARHQGAGAAQVEPRERSSPRRRSAARRKQGESFAGWLCDLAGRTKDLIDEVNSADLVVMVAAAGESAQAASIIGEACSVKRVMTTALVIGGAAVSDEALSKTLSHLRPWALMLVIASAEDYIADMLTALRA